MGDKRLRFAKRIWLGNQAIQTKCRRCRQAPTIQPHGGGQQGLPNWQKMALFGPLSIGLLFDRWGNFEHFFNGGNPSRNFLCTVEQQRLHALLIGRIAKGGEIGVGSNQLTHFIG